MPARVDRRAPAAALIALPLLGALALALAPGDGVASGPRPITQPEQPQAGPGGSDYAYRAVRVSSGGTGADAWYAFEPIKPKAGTKVRKRLPLAVVMHGYGEFEGYSSMRALIRHTVRKGSVAIDPRWQTGIATPCPGPFDVEPCIDSAVNGIGGALDHLRASPKRIRPRLAQTSYFGFSFGGIVTVNMANRWRVLGLPKPRAIFLDDLHDGGLAGPGEPALDDSLAGIPAGVKLECHTGQWSVESEDGTVNTCNALFPMLDRIPARNKDIVLTYDDDHGTPPLSSAHGVCAAGPGFGPPDAYDWSFCWKVWEALRSCALEQRFCRYALGDTRRHRSLGRWSDGRPVTPLKVQDEAPILP